jgi:hypothetical protein
MIELLTSLVALVPATIISLALYRRARAAEVRAEAEKIWAARIDPMNPHFRQPLIGRKE